MQTTTSFFERIRLDGNPVAPPENIVIHGNARFTILTPRLMRLEWSSNGQFDDRATFAFPNRAAAFGEFSVMREDAPGTERDGATIDTGALVLRYHGSDAFNEDNLSITVKGHTIWCPGRPHTGNLRGTRRTLDGIVGDAALDAGLLSRDGWSVFDDTAALRFDPDDHWLVAPQSAANETVYLDWYFFGYGHDYKAALADYQRVGGATPLIPRFVLGAWWSRYWAYSEQDLRDLVADFRKHDLPLDVLVIDMDWHTEDHWTGYTWNRKLFPDPAGFLKWLHEQGLRVTLNLHPAGGVQHFEAIYPTFAERMGLQLGEGDAATPAPIPFRVMDKNFIQNYFELLHHPLEEEGVDFWWMDWQQGKTDEGVDPLLWLNHLHFLDLTRRGGRGMLYSRWGGLGNHRYPIGFSGDTHAFWPALQFQPYMTATAANVGYGWWSHDIGGHMGETEPELFARWVQYGALSPCLRLHSSKQEEAERRPYAFPEPVLKASREAFKLRYALVPYLYTMARLNSDTGVSLCYPMYYDYPESEEAYTARYQYMFGTDILAAPIVFPADAQTGLAVSDVWIPPGTWYDYQTMEQHSGPRWVRAAGDLNRMPMFVRAGTILLLSPEAYTTEVQPKDHLILRVFPGAQGEFKLYEDDGATLAHLRGEHEWTTFTQTRANGRITLALHPTEGRCAALSTTRAYTVQLESVHPPTTLTVNGQTVNFSYDRERRRAEFAIPPTDKRQSVLVEIEAADATAEHQAVLLQRELAYILGDAPDASAQGDALIERILDADPQGASAWLAAQRLGVPFVRVFEYTAPEDAVKRLGRLLVAGDPLVGEARIRGRWTLKTDRVETREFELRGTSLLLDSPFALSDFPRTAQWSVDVELDWRGRTYRYQHTSEPISPAVYAWRVAIYPKDRAPYTLAEFLTPEHPLHDAPAWKEYIQTPDHMISAESAFGVDLGDRYNPGVEQELYAVSVIHSPSARDVVIQYWSASEQTWLYLNGEQVGATEKVLKGTGYRGAKTLPQTEVLHLQAGRNVLALRALRRPMSWYWGFSAAVISPEGEVQYDLSYTTR